MFGQPLKVGLATSSNDALTNLNNTKDLETLIDLMQHDDTGTVEEANDIVSNENDANGESSDYLPVDMTSVLLWCAL